MKRLSLTLIGVALSVSACAQSSAPATAAKPGAKSTVPAIAEPAFAAGTPEARARAAIRKINPNVSVDKLGPAPIPGFRQAVVAGEVFYISDDGKYLMQGKLFDIATRKDLGMAALEGVRRDLVRTIPLRDRIVFAPPNPKYTVTVFTDIECGFCRKFHSQIGEYNKQGIAVQYVAFPRMGLGSDDYKKMVAVWCAADKRQALTDAKNDRPIPMKTCTNPVTMEYDVGRRAGLEGTPLVLTPDGAELGGYLPPDRLRAALDAHAAGKQAVKQGQVEPVATGAAGAR
jgi:thiol:disulfide interchange protein DsbC